MRGFVCSLIMVLGVASASQAQPPPLEAFAALPRLQDVALSPNGRRIAALINGEDGQRIVRVFDYSSGEPVPLGAGLDASAIKANAVEWANDDYVLLWVSDERRLVYFVESNIEIGGVFSWKVGEAPRQLLADSRDLAINESLSNVLATLPGEDKVLMAAYAKSRSGGATAAREYAIFEVDLRRGGGRVQLRGDSTLTRQFWVDSEGTARARLDHDARSNWWRLSAYEGRRRNEILEITDSSQRPFGTLGLTSDSNHLVTSSFAATGEAQVRLLSLADGSFSEPIFSRANTDIGGPIVNRRTDETLGFWVTSVDGPQYVFFNSDLQTMMEDVAARMPASSVRPRSWSDDKRRWVFHAEGGDTAGIFLLYDRSDGAFVSVGGQYPGIPPEHIAMVQSIEYRARDGLTITGLLTLPVGAAPENLPTVVLPHGGPESHDSYGWNWMAQYFANQGYAVLQPNFRGSDGFGPGFTRAGYGEWGRAMQDDVTDGVNAMVAAGYTDPERVCIVGWSYGGYAALAGAVFTPELYRCVIAGAGVSDLNRMLSGTIRATGRRSQTVDYWRAVMEGPDAETRLRDVSPVHFAENVQAPVLLIHGRDDTVVEIDQSRAMLRALEDAQKQVEFLELRGEDHDLMVPETRIEAMRAMDTFLKTHLGPGAGGG